MKEFPSLGRHILIEMFDCNSDILNDVMAIENIMIGAATRASATIIQTVFHRFSPHGVSGVVVIQESHLSIHTWPEFKYAAVDIYTCGDTIDPWVAYNYIKEQLQAKFASPIEVLRGQKHLLNMTSFDIRYSPMKYLENKPEIKPVIKREIWFTEKHHDIAYSFRCKSDSFYRDYSKYQKIEIYDTNLYGKMLVLDGLVMTSEKDEFCYHEMMVYPAMMVHDSPKKILIIGGGDGGVLTCLSRFPEIEKINIVEIDEKVIEVSKKFLPEIAKGFSDPRVNVIIDDGAAFVVNSQDHQYDIIFIDCSDPSGPSMTLFTEDFYRNIKRVCKRDGIVILQTESPFFSIEVMKKIYERLASIWTKNNLFMYVTTVPSYTSGFWTYAFCSTTYHPVKNLKMDKAENVTKTHNLKYYSPQIHIFSFILPRFLKDEIPYIANSQEDFNPLVYLSTVTQ